MIVVLRKCTKKFPSAVVKVVFFYIKFQLKNFYKKLQIPDKYSKKWYRVDMRPVYGPSKSLITLAIIVVCGALYRNSLQSSSKIPEDCKKRRRSQKFRKILESMKQSG